MAPFISPYKHTHTHCTFLKQGDRGGDGNCGSIAPSWTKVLLSQCAQCRPAQCTTDGSVDWLPLYLSGRVKQQWGHRDTDSAS